MEEGFNQAYTLLGVGMLTVFAVLLFVVLIGNGIILFTNRFFPGIKSPNKPQEKDSEIDASKMAALVAAVKRVSGGRGKISSVKRK
ncbi:OadG family protein [Marinilabilia sp.]